MHASKGIRRFLKPLLFAPLCLTCCYGSFSAVKGLHQWNGQVSQNKFVNTLLFWGLVIVPVYELWTLGDAIIFNVIEFWSGSNPVAAGPGLGTGAPIAMADGSFVFHREGKQYRITSRGSERAALFVDGARVADVERTDAGDLVLLDHKHGRTRMLHASVVESLKAHFGPTEEGASPAGAR